MRFALPYLGVAPGAECPDAAAATILAPSGDRDFRRELCDPLPAG